MRRVVALLLIVASTATLPARLLAQSTAPAPVESNPVPIVRKPAEWNLGDQRLAIEGYDAVAYFPEGGGQPKSGDAALQVEHGGVLYRFATAAHRDLFLKDPARYEPAFGGWCAYAMGQKQGERVEVDPESFLITDGRLLLFYDGLFADTRAKWIEAKGAALPTADGNWKRLSGEEPRLGGHPSVAPDFELMATGGAVVRLSEHRGQVVVLCFTARWSEPSQRGRALLQPLAARHAGRPLVAFAIDAFGDLSRSDEENGPSAPIAPAIELWAGDSVARRYGIEELPTFIVIAPDGAIVHRSTGLPSGSDVQLAAAVESALAASTSSPAPAPKPLPAR